MPSSSSVSRADQRFQESWPTMLIQYPMAPAKTNKFLQFHVRACRAARPALLRSIMRRRWSDFASYPV